jgi:hypothetical protein
MKSTVPVTPRALIQRINRVLANEGRIGRQLKTTRGLRAHNSLGDYYILDLDKNWIVNDHVDLETVGRKLDCLQAWEHLEG